ncbi:MAG: hypothetical protein Q4G28_07080 [Neisseria sp.]|nr:hypothetical protein [Neisseria sp.]
MKPLFIHRISCHHSRSDADEKSLRAALKTAHGYDGRRLSRFTLNALAAALPLTLPPDSGVYLGASFSSPAKFDNMLATIAEGGTPKPFDFIGNIHNAACFQTAQALGLHGPSVFLPLAAAPQQWPQPLLAAWLDIRQSSTSTALVGWCSEESSSQAQAEGCCWLVLSAQQHPDSLAALTLRPSENRRSVSDGLNGASVYQAACGLAERIQAGKSTVLTAALGRDFVIEAV